MDSFGKPVDLSLIPRMHMGEGKPTTLSSDLRVPAMACVPLPIKKKNIKGN